MTRLTSQRGVSLMLLIIAITVFGAVAIGIVTLLRSRHESYPYQVQSYQAYALANAGAQFAIQYARENHDPVTGGFSFPNSNPFSLGNGTFSLRYQHGCPDALYSRGTCGSATREVRLTNFGRYAGSGGGSVYLSSAVTRIPYTSAGIYSGDRIEFTFCDPSRLGPPGNAFWSFLKMNSITIAATQPISIMRVAPVKPGSAYYQWVWDGACGAGSMGNCQAVTLTPWDGISDPPNASFTPVWNIANPVELTYDSTCRPRACPMDSTTYPADSNGCSIYPGKSRTHANCGTALEIATIRDLFFGAWQGHFAIETRGSIPSGTKFYVAFDHVPSVALSPPPFSPGAWVRNKFIFTPP